MIKIFKAVTVFGGLALALGGAGAKADLINNGSFESTTHGTGQLGYNTNINGWTNSGYNFVFAPGTADGSGAATQFNNTLKLWGPGTGVANGLTATSPDGGNFIAADGAFNTGPITQTINGLVAGTQYAVGFYYAGAQQDGYTGNTTEQWIVSLGGQSQSTPILNDVSHGFTGWNHAVFTFTADGSSDVLSFLASGTPDGEPPFSLLDGVTMTAVPEPASMTILGGGLLALGFVRRRRNKQ